MNRRAAAAGSFLCLTAGALLLLQITSGCLSRITIPISAEKIEPVEGSVFRAGGSNLKMHLENAHRRALVTENGIPLPKRELNSKHVKEGGPGTYSLGAKSIWFTTSDGSDPRTNGRKYEAQFPRVPPSGSFAVLLVLLATGVDLGCRALWRTSLWRLVRTYYLPNLRPTPLAGERSRQWSLDTLRAFAILLVLGCHMMPIAPKDAPFFSVACWTVKIGGWVGVDLFFVLSGYLVSGLLWSEWRRTGSIHAARFLIRRGFKIYPPFFTMLISTLLCIAALDLQHPAVTVEGVIGEFFFLQNYVGLVWTPTWSLAVEEHFYLLLTLLFVLLSQPGSSGGSTMGSRMRLFPRLFFVIAAGCLFLRCIRALFLGDAASQGNLFSTHTRIDSLMFGVLVQYCRVRWPDEFLRTARKGRWLWAAAGVASFASAFVFPVTLAPWRPAIWMTLLYLGGGCLILAAVALENHAWLEKLFRPLRMVGCDSYSIYLWHMPVVWWLATPAWWSLVPDHPFAAWWVCNLIYFTGSILVGILMSMLVERPLLRLRDDLFPSLSRSTLPAVDSLAPAHSGGVIRVSSPVDISGI